MNTRENNLGATLIHFLPDALNSRMTGEGQVAVRWAGQTILFNPVWVGQGFPADVRRQQEKLSSPGKAGVPVLIANEMSKGARKLLNDSEISWVDRKGYGRISAPNGIFVSREPIDQSVVPKRRTHRGLRWSPLLSDITEVVLSAVTVGNETAAGGNQVLSPAAIADLVESSYASAAKALTMLDAAGFTEKAGATRGPTAHRILREPGELLSEWVGYYTTRLVPIETRFHVPWRNPEESLRLLNGSTPKEPIMVSGAYASSLLAPFLTQVPDLLAYAEMKHYQSVCESIERNADVTRVQTGERIRLRSVGSHLRAYTRSTKRGILLAPPVRVYADLMAEGGRSEEAAEVLRSEIIGW